jgi:hypothetical protein
MHSRIARSARERRRIAIAAASIAVMSAIAAAALIATAAVALSVIAANVADFVEKIQAERLGFFLFLLAKNFPKILIYAIFSVIMKAR